MSHTRRTTFGAHILCLLAVCMASVLPACGRNSTKTAPRELVGIWTAAGPLYADRTLEIREDRLYFGTGGTEDREPLTIVRVRSEQAADHTLYSIEYQSSDGADFTLPIQLFAGGRELRLANREQVVWTLSAPSTPSSGKST